MRRGAFGIDDLVGAVRAHIERDAPPSPVGDVADGETWTVDRAYAIRDLLWEHKNPKSGMPLARLRPGPRAVVPILKKVFRRIFQPFINETLERQLRFNDAVVTLADEVGLRARELDELAERLAEAGLLRGVDGLGERDFGFSRVGDS